MLFCIEQLTCTSLLLVIKRSENCRDRRPRRSETVVINSVAGVVDLIVGAALKTIPPVEALFSTGIYYAKQTAKYIWIGY